MNMFVIRAYIAQIIEVLVEVVVVAAAASVAVAVAVSLVTLCPTYNNERHIGIGTQHV